MIGFKNPNLIDIIDEMSGGFVDQRIAGDRAMQLLMSSGIFLFPGRDSRYKFKEWPDSDADSIFTLGPWNMSDVSFEWTRLDDIINDIDESNPAQIRSMLTLDDLFKFLSVSGLTTESQVLCLAAKLADSVEYALRSGQSQLVDAAL